MTNHVINGQIKSGDFRTPVRVVLQDGASKIMWETIAGTMIELDKSIPLKKGDTLTVTYEVVAEQ